MTSRIQDAVIDAMARLKASDVSGATALIRNALIGGGSASRAQQATRARLTGQARRGLGDVLNLLKMRRNDFPTATARPRTQPSPEDPRFTSRSLTTGAGNLNYKLYIPADRDRELALVLMLHGCTQDPDDFARGTRMNHLADELGLVVAYPHQPRSANAQGCWNWFDRRHQSVGSGEPAKLAALAQALTAEFCIAPKRVFAAGLSAGAAMADILAETYPEVFSKVGLHSGLQCGAAHDVMSAFAAMKGDGAVGRIGVRGEASRKIIIHGTADQTVHPSNGDRLFEAMRFRHRGSTVIISEVKSAGKSTMRQALIDPSGVVLAEYLPIEGAGHAWSGGDRAGSFTAPDGPDASREMVSFFLRP